MKTHISGITFQHEPENQNSLLELLTCAWFFTAVTAPFLTQSTSFGATVSWYRNSPLYVWPRLSCLKSGR